MAARIRIEATIADLSGSSVAPRLPASNAPRVFVNWLINMLSAFLAGAHRARLRVSVDDSLGVAAALTITCVQASAAAGDTLVLTMADGKVFRFTAVSGTPVPANGEYAIITSNTAVANSIRAAMAAVPGFLSYLTPSGTATLILTAKVAGSMGNLIRATKTGVSAAFTGTGLFTGGIDPGALQTLTYTVTNVTTAGDTLTIGSVVLTAAASAANENEYTIGGTAGATATNIKNAINAHTKLKGLVLASATGTSTGIVTIALLMGGRIGSLIAVLKNSAVGTLSAASFVPSTTDVYSSGAGGIEYNLGAL